MSDKTTRRGFFGLFSKGAAGALAAGMTIGVDHAAKAEDKTVFNFTCSCGDGLAGNVPKEVGESLRLTCAGCEMVWQFTWAGDHFKTRNWPLHKANAGWNPPAHFNEREMPEDQLKKIDWSKSSKQAIAKELYDHGDLSKAGLLKAWGSDDAI